MPESRVALFLSIDIIVTIATLGLVSLRVGYRWAKGKINISDYLICAAEFAAVMHMVLDIVITTDFGYARHQIDLPPDLRGSWKTSIMFWLIQIFTKIPLMFSKLSLCLVYRDLLHFIDLPIVRVTRMVNGILMAILAGFFTAATFVGILLVRLLRRAGIRRFLVIVLTRL